MCGLVGILVRDPALEGEIGQYFSTMLEEMTARGPDSAGLAIYDRGVPAGATRYSLRTDNPHANWEAVKSEVETATGASATIEINGHVAFLTTAANVAEVHTALAASEEQIIVVGEGHAMSLIKDVGLPGEICDRYDVSKVTGYMALGHTRMATESAVTIDGAHPFSPRPDLALVHNGSFSNHATIRRQLADEGVHCITQNDTEVCAQYIGWRMAEGDTLEDAMRHVLKEFAGYFTLVVSTENAFSVVRDAFACKPMVVAETDQYVAVASEYHALAGLPGIENARVFEPQPEEIHTWTV